MDGTAIILTNGLLTESAAKTAHGLIRGTLRYRILAVVDEAHAGMDAGVVLDGQNRRIPIMATVTEAIKKVAEPINYCLVGIAPKGGKLPGEMKSQIRECICNQIHIVSGLHDFISDMPEMLNLANQYKVSITDIRKPKKREELHFWSGKIYNIRALTIAVLGTDTCLGKRTTARFLTDACTVAGIRTGMISTGQTGWMQDGQYGFVLDTTINDFVSGELEHAIFTCDQETKPDLIVVEGQSGLRNPTGPCGSEFLLSGNIRHVILQHAPKRKWYGENQQWGEIPTLASELALIRMYGARVEAVTLNTQGCTPLESGQFRSSYEKDLNIPVVLPLEEGVDRLVNLMKKLMEIQKQTIVNPGPGD